eukprot:TRINITY_DN3331_c0_g1_i1.p1 TRINITY_DN3331_c0_g1~~TRINITY_DN3331_c0_g1_i1.p1  ORF type:complete len:454 (-),score=81.73 TRINITY_DN3331_c0_g1_i1:130-1491(-)
MFWSSRSRGVVANSSPATTFVQGGPALGTRLGPVAGTYVQGGPPAASGAYIVQSNDDANIGCMTACLEPAPSYDTEDWQYVGSNRGAYEQVGSLQYVGPGNGSIDKVVITKKEVSYSQLFIPFSCLMLTIIGLLLFLIIRNQRPVYWSSDELDVAVTSVPFDCDAGLSNWLQGWSETKKSFCCRTEQKGCPAELKECVLWGDPHIKTFDTSRLVFYSTGDFWLVKAPRISIQGRFQATDWTKKNDKTDYSSMTSIIVGGAFLGQHKIEVQSMLGKIMCDGVEVLTAFGSSQCGGATITYNDVGALVDQAMAFLPHKVVHIALPNEVSMQVNRWPNFINAAIKMSKRPGQDGICGNYNGDANDDMGKDLHQRFGQGVNKDELLFGAPIPLLIPKALPSDKRCPPDRKQRAEAICHAEETAAGWSFAECMGDVCDAHTAGQPSIQAQEMREQMGQ